MNTYFIQFVLVTGLSLATGCASNRVRSVDTALDVKGTTSSGTLGLKENIAIIQQETHADDQLRSVQWSNNQYEDRLNREYFDLKRCRNDLADPRLSGNGEVVQLPEIDNLKQTSEIKEQFGLNESKDLIFLTQEDFLKRIAIERHYQKTLQQMMKTVLGMREECERKMSYARVKAGLPGQRIQGKAKLTSSGTVEQVVQKHENSLDDAFAMSSSEE